jgi:hypothetical protein
MDALFAVDRAARQIGSRCAAITEFRTSAIQQFLNRPNATPYGALKTRTFADILEVQDELKQRTLSRTVCGVVGDIVYRIFVPKGCPLKTDVEHTANRTLKRD